MNKYTLAAVPVVCLAALLLCRHVGSTVAKRRCTDKEKREAYDALHFMSTARAFPNDDMPDGAYADAYAFYKERYLNAAPNRAASWENIGPANIGGRTIAVAIDPVDTNVVWLGSASGGLWKSTTGGVGVNAWAYVPTGYPVLAVSAIAIDPADHNTMFIGTGETYDYGVSTNGLVTRTERGTFGIGILKSTDGGLTWSPSLDWAYQQNRGVWEIMFNPRNAQVLYAATTEGVFKSTDAGANWSNALPKKMVMNLEIDKVDTGIVYAGVGNLNSTEKGLYKTSNGGATWNVLTNGLPPNTHGGRITISAYSANNKILMCEVADSFSTVGIYRSNNEGQSWTAVDAGTEVASWQGWYAKCLAMKADDSSRVIVGGVDLFRSDDGGSFLYQIGFDTFWVHSDFHGLVTNPLDPNKIYVISDGGLFRSDNFGETFYDCNDGYVTSQAYIGSVSTQDSTIALVGCQDNYTSRYYGNPYWLPVYGGDGSFNAIDPLDDQHQLASWQYLNMLESDDQGFTFNPVYAPVTDPNGGNAAAFIAPMVMAPSDPYTVYAGDTVLIKSDDGGFSWLLTGPSPLDNGNKLLTIAVSATNPDSLYYATAPTANNPMHVFRSANGGQSRVDITGSLPNRYPRDIAVNPHNSREVYIVFSGFGSGHAFRSTDAGESWMDVSAALPDVPFHCVTLDPQHPERVFVGCDFGVFASGDHGDTWTVNANGMPDAVMVFDLVVSPSDRKLMAFTHGHGVYKISLDDLILTAPIHQPVSLDVTLFPNPASDAVVIKGINEMCDATFYNAAGKMMKRILNSSPRLDVSDLPNGVYTVRLRSGSRESVTKLAVLR